MGSCPPGDTWVPDIVLLVPVRTRELTPIGGQDMSPQLIWKCPSLSVRFVRGQRPPSAVRAILPSPGGSIHWELRPPPADLRALQTRSTTTVGRSRGRWRQKPLLLLPPGYGMGVCSLWREQPRVSYQLLLHTSHIWWLRCHLSVLWVGRPGTAHRRLSRAAVLSQGLTGEGFASLWAVG